MRRYVPALALLAAVACGGDDPAGTLPSALPPASTGGTPSPSPTAGPAVQIEAAVRAYFALLEDAGHTGDPREFEQLLAPSCPCREQAAYIRREAAKGHTVTTSYRVEAIAPADVTATNARATVTYSAPESVVVDRSARKVRTLAALKSVGVVLHFRRTGGRWLVVRLDRLGA